MQWYNILVEKGYTNFKEVLATTATTHKAERIIYLVLNHTST